MSNYIDVMDQLFSSSQKEGALNESIPSTLINTPVTCNLLNSNNDEIVEQMIHESEVEQEVKIILKEQQVECQVRELINSTCGVDKNSGQFESNGVKVSVEYDLNQEDLLSNEDFGDDNESDMEIDSNKNNDKHNFDVEEFLDSHHAYLKQKEEEKEKKYYIEPVEQYKDFSEYGDFAVVMQAGHENDYREYLEKVQEMKKKRVEDERREKALEKAKRDEAARKSKKEKLEKKLISLTKKIAKLGLGGNAVDFNDKMKWIQIETYRPFYRVVDHSGMGILSADFIELSSTERAFYYYDRCDKIYKLYKWDTVDLRYSLDHSCEKQQDLWFHIRKRYPENNYGFKFIRNNF